MHPKSSSEVTAFGSAISQIVSLPEAVNEFAKDFTTAVLPHPGFPIIKQQ